MALAAVQPAMNHDEHKGIHPFFSRPLRNDALEQQTPDAATSIAEPYDDPDCEQPESGAQKGKKRGRKPGSTKGRNVSRPGEDKQPSLENFTRRTKVENTNEPAPIPGQLGSAEPSLVADLNHDRRKRRKTATPEPPRREADGGDLVSGAGSLSWHQQLQAEAKRASNSCKDTQIDQPDGPTPTHPVSEIEDSRKPGTQIRDTVDESTLAAVHEPAAEAPQSCRTTPKKKVLKVNKNGKLLSSPTALKEQPEPTTPKKRRGRKAAKPKVLPTVTVIKYGVDAASRQATGAKIDNILNGAKTTRRPKTPKKPLKPAGPPKPTHPFFLGNAAQKKEETVAAKLTTENSLPSPRAQRQSAVTPGKLRAESRRHHASTPMPTFGFSAGNRPAKQSGQGEPPWPSKETAHVRNLDLDTTPDIGNVTQPSSLRARKMKSNVFSVPLEEDMMMRLAQQLNTLVYGSTEKSKSDFDPPPDVRLPTRLLTNGANIQAQVRSQVGAHLLSGGNALDDNKTTHPAIQALFRDIEHTLTPFDLGKCESQSWVQKYAPKTTAHVLQPGKEAAVLYDWLRNLTVLAVEGKHGTAKANVTSEAKKPPKKKRKKTEDDFIVDSDEEEEEEMIEIDGGDYSAAINMSTLRSIRRANWTRNKNVVLISGPHGCGKSAMVHAVAHDLGFEVFEIHSGTRRSGRDIQDKVGDMSENHLVNHKRNEGSNKEDTAPAEDADNERHSKVLQKDIDSGRQGTMTAFFKSSGPVKSKPKAMPKAKEPQKRPTPTQATLPIVQSQRQSQKQSLILFDEADVLFEEDQQFWAQVTKLASQSKRPIVITCKNEALVPIHQLPLAAALRLSPPPLDLAVDYLLTLVGREGHILRRDAISSIYTSKNYDLRATITELNLWCQMSVGDRKGGLEWMYQRWPPGKDVDESGRILRVASKDTYLPGMGSLSHNTFACSDSVGFNREGELLKEVWADWGIRPSEWNDPDKGKKLPGLTETSLIEELKHLDALSDSISAADIYCRFDMPSYEQYFDQPTDPSLPPLPPKERLNYTLAAPVIQVDHVSDFSGLDTDLFVQSHILIKQAFGGRQALDSEELQTIPLTEEGYAQVISQHKRYKQAEHQLSRPDFSLAFDLLAYHPDALLSMNTSHNLTASSFDRTFSIIVEDVAPYVRTIVAHELDLEAQRIRLGNLLSEGGRAKRARTTRAARTALEGGNRETKRRERWFDQDLNRALVMATAGKSWTGMDSGAGAEETEVSSKTGGSLPGTQEE